MGFRGRTAGQPGRGRFLCGRGLEHPVFQRRGRAHHRIPAAGGPGPQVPRGLLFPLLRRKLPAAPGRRFRETGSRGPAGHPGQVRTPSGGGDHRRAPDRSRGPVGGGGAYVLRGPNAPGSGAEARRHAGPGRVRGPGRENPAHLRDPVPGRPHRRTHPDPGGDRDRQGPPGQGRSRPKQPVRRSFRRHQLRGPARGTPGIRALRLPEGGLHRRQGRQAGHRADGRGGHGLSRRGRRTALPLQSKLLQVIEEKRFHPLGATSPQTVDVRIVAATNRHLRSLADAGRFRPDL